MLAGYFAWSAPILKKPGFLELVELIISQVLEVVDRA